MESSRQLEKLDKRRSSIDFALKREGAGEGGRQVTMGEGSVFYKRLRLD